MSADNLCLENKSLLSESKNKLNASLDTFEVLKKKRKELNTIIQDIMEIVFISFAFGFYIFF